MWVVRDFSLQVAGSMGIDPKKKKLNGKEYLDKSLEEIKSSSGI